MLHVILQLVFLIDVTTSSIHPFDPIVEEYQDCEECEEAFLIWMKRYNKTYVAGSPEFIERLQIWQQSFREVSIFS